MNSLPKELHISIGDAAAIAIEVWRLTKLIEGTGSTGDSASIRYSLRQFNRVLSNLEIVTTDLAGRPYEAGLIEDVVDVVEDPRLPSGQQFIEEMVSPTVLWQRNVVQPGQIIVRKAVEETERGAGV
ncbi:MAG: hypothetical protein JST61_09785 [Acidobacteria bacterium]|nr:hypothetical protein [Acidobacteriota bacterium]